MKILPGIAATCSTTMRTACATKCPQFVRSAVFWSAGPRVSGARLGARFVRGRATSKSFAHSAGRLFFNSISYFRPDEKQRLFTPDFQKSLGEYDTLDVFRDTTTAPTPTTSSQKSNIWTSKRTCRTTSSRKWIAPAWPYPSKFALRSSTSIDGKSRAHSFFPETKRPRPKIHFQKGHVLDAAGTTFFTGASRASPFRWDSGPPRTQEMTEKALFDSNDGILDPAFPSKDLEAASERTL